MSSNNILRTISTFPALVPAAAYTADSAQAGNSPDGNSPGSVEETSARNHIPKGWESFFSRSDPIQADSDKSDSRTRYSLSNVLDSMSTGWDDDRDTPQDSGSYLDGLKFDLRVSAEAGTNGYKFDEMASAELRLGKFSNLQSRLYSFGKFERQDSSTNEGTRAGETEVTAGLKFMSMLNSDIFSALKIAYALDDTRTDSALESHTAHSAELGGAIYLRPIELKVFLDGSLPIKGDCEISGKGLDYNVWEVGLRLNYIEPDSNEFGVDARLRHRHKKYGDLREITETNAEFTALWSPQSRFDSNTWSVPDWIGIVGKVLVKDDQIRGDTESEILAGAEVYSQHRLLYNVDARVKAKALQTSGDSTDYSLCAGVMVRF